MKTLFFLILLVFPILLNAQQVKTPDESRAIELQTYSHTYFIDLKIGNKMRIDVYDRYAPTLHYNIDSLMEIAVQSFKLIEDSLESDYYARTMEINLYDTLLRSVGWGSTPPSERRILVYDSTHSIVKFLQDTVFINVHRVLPTAYNYPPSFLKITMVLNNLRKIANFNTGQYHKMFDSLDANNNRHWYPGINGLRTSNQYPELQLIRAYDERKLQRSFTANISFSAQNYRDHFTPSVNVGIGMITEQNYIREEIWLGHETVFTFQPDKDGHNSTYANQFITLRYRTKNLNMANNNIVGVFPNLTLAYLVKRSGDVFDKHTFKLGIAGFSTGKGKLSIEPVFYFTNLFRHVSPGFRITQSF
ncbi:hypothetical protein [Ferruginibacter sp. HRS2-29]|uniref:hypothetical protein n=1 Tax=Ferruginibacter sp. HRS2-29 TaxID=2487334 RepID=UPI0020CBE592|nr:hypothetical protein [Ferruginibacter sp. HRS2-29]MCP9749487.1 hypothetical protein [Ferruginibacter sp. HRS2-29]